MEAVAGEIGRDGGRQSLSRTVAAFLHNDIKQVLESVASLALRVFFGSRFFFLELAQQEHEVQCLESVAWMGCNVAVDYFNQNCPK